jgi:hypothetical protein
VHTRGPGGREQINDLLVSDLREVVVPGANGHVRLGSRRRAHRRPPPANDSTESLAPVGAATTIVANDSAFAAFTAASMVAPVAMPSSTRIAVLPLAPGELRADTARRVDPRFRLRNRRLATLR